MQPTCAAAGWYVFLGQRVHDVGPGTSDMLLYVPGWHMVRASLVAIPGAPHAKPGVHGLQTAEPGTSAIVPGRQSVQPSGTALSLAFPAGHIVHWLAVSAPMLGCSYPAAGLHSRQEIAPAANW